MKNTQLGNSSQGKNQPHPMSLRLVEIRREFYGERGRSQFARELGIPLTSYIHYETDRAPPADVLVQAAQLTGTSLEWLLCGTGERRRATLDATDVAARMLDRLQEIFDAAPELVPSVEEYVELLHRKFARKTWPAALPSAGMPNALIPVIGSTAAGLARFWEEVGSDLGGSDADARLEEVLAVHAQQAACPGQAVSLSPDDVEAVALIQFSQPDEQGILEFLDAARIKSQYPDAVAWRIDGNSMSPRYRDGDFVITSPQHPAIDMQPCVARQRGQIGVNCKLYHARGDTILLIPIHEDSRIQSLSSQQLLWAWRVLASVRLQESTRLQ